MGIYREKTAACDAAISSSFPPNLGFCLVDNLARRDPLRVGWNDFRARHAPADWKIYVDERSALPTVVSGPGVGLVPAADLPSLTLDEVEAHVRAFLLNQRGLPGDGSGILALDAGSSAETRDGHWQLVFRQHVDGVTVENPVWSSTSCTAS